MKTDILKKFYPGISNINEKIYADAVARANAMLLAANHLSGYTENALRQLSESKNFQNY